MIKNLLWKQALELAKKKFGNLNTNEANKWLMDKYNALLGKENTKNIANKIREDLKKDRPFDNWKPEVVEHDPFKNLRGDESFDELIELGGKKIKKFDPFKKEGKKIDFMDYYGKRKRGEFDDGGMILPQPKPYNFEEKIEFLKKIKDGVGPKTYLQIMSDTLNEGVENKAISKEERDNFLKRFTGTISEDWTSAIDDENLYMYEGDYERYPPKFNEGGLAGMLGETQQIGYATDRTKIVKELYDAAGGFDGTGKSFEEFMADVLFEGDYLAKGGRVGLKGGGMTPSEKWMRDYYFDGKGGYDQWMSFQEFQMGPGVDLWYKHIGKYAEGGRAGYLKGGLLRTGIMEALDKLTRKGTRQGVDVRETILPADDVGDYAINMGDVRELFKNLDEKFANKITSKESIDEIITRFRDTRKLDLSESIKEFLNNRIKQYKSGLENIKKYGQVGPIEEVGDHAEELRYLIKETRKDLDAIDKYGLIQQSKKATKHAEGGVVGLKNGGTLLEKYKEYAPKGAWTKGLTDAEITYELYNLLAPYMSLFMKEGGRVGFKEGKGMSRRAFLKLMGAAATLPVVGKFFKLAKPASKVMDDIKITLKGDGDWSLEDDMWSGGNWVNYSFEALTDKGKQILTKLTKGKNASLVDQGDGVFYPGKTVDSKVGYYLADEAEHAVDAVDAIKKAKGNISLNTQVGSKVKGAKPEKYKDMDLGYSTKTYGSKEINKKTILNEADDYWVGDYGGYRNKGFYDENVEEIIDIITKKAEGGRIGLDAGGPPIKPEETPSITDYLKITGQGGMSSNKNIQQVPGLDQDQYNYNFNIDARIPFDLPGGGILELGGNTGFGRGRTDTTYKGHPVPWMSGMDEQKLGDQWNIGAKITYPFKDGGSVLQRPMFYQGGLTKTVPPEKGPMPQGLQSNVYDGIMRPGVINGRN